jgi:predicted nucleotidyltransferase
MYAMNPRVSVDRERIAGLCRRLGIKELSLFGSVLREDFRPDSDVDVLVEYRDGAGLRFSEYLAAETELTGLFGRGVDLVTRKAVRNPFVRHHILNNRVVIYPA